MEKTRVAIIGTTGLPAKYGGFETLAHHLVDRLNQRYDLTVYCSSKYFAEKGKRRTHFNGAKLYYLPLNANGYQSIMYDFISIIHAIRNSEVLLILGVSGTLLLPIIKLFSKKPIIVNIDGQEWKRDKWNWITRKFLGLSEKIAIRFADKIIADNKVIYDYVTINYNCKKTALIEYGSDHVKPIALHEDIISIYPFLSSPYAFNVCRIEPENQVHVLLETYAQRPNENLVVIGLWSHNLYAIELRNSYEKYPNIFMLDPIYEQTTLDTIRSNAKVYLHGHSVGGTNPSLVEAMALGLPVIAYDVSYNRETTEHAALFFKDSNELHMRLNATNNSSLKMIGQKLKSIAERRYNWRRIAELYASSFEGNNYDITEIMTSEIANREASTINISTKEKEREIA
jgi:glycosyltransferase involved in cell wall biosynthesis